jgi:hypothetical protein
MLVRASSPNNKAYPLLSQINFKLPVQFTPYTVSQKGAFSTNLISQKTIDYFFPILLE